VKITPAQQSFSAGEISPLMYNRTDTEGYQQGVVRMENMFADSRGPAFSRGGSRYIGEYPANDGRVVAIPVSDNFFYSGIFLDQKLIIGSMVGHNPGTSYTSNSNFNLGGDSWTVATDGNASSTVTFPAGTCRMSVSDNNNRWVYITQQITLPATGNYKLSWEFTGNADLTFKIGTSADNGSIHESIHTPNDSSLIFNATATDVWVTARMDSDNVTLMDTKMGYFGVSPEVDELLDFDTPYLEEHLETLQGIQSPSGGATYIVHELYPPYKLIYDATSDSFTWEIVTFTEPPTEWIEGSYPSCGDFFEGRLWLGGTKNEPQTFWASKSGVEEDFTQGVLADDGLQFTMAKFGRIEWMVGFKNLVIGTQNGEHIVTSVGGFIQPDDIQVEQQSSYGSANVQPVQVGDQIFYVSADRRKLRAIQYEWQKDNWLSKDLTFNSEHITKAGIKHITWQQNPNNLFHCILHDGTLASLTYERGHDVYGWARVITDGEIIDATTGAINGTDYANWLVKRGTVNIMFETQPTQPPNSNRAHMDTWVSVHTVDDGNVVTGLDYLEGKEVQITINGAIHPNRTVVNGEVTLQNSYPSVDDVDVGLQFTPLLQTLPMNKPMASGGSEPYMKRWNKIYLRLLDSTMPLVNGERAPERQPQSPMNEPQPNVNEEILKINLGYDRNQTITIAQDLPHKLIVLGVFGELAQSKL